jgi:hypothetical protein
MWIFGLFSFKKIIGISKHRSCKKANEMQKYAWSKAATSLA